MYFKLFPPPVGVIAVVSVAGDASVIELLEFIRLVESLRLCSLHEHMNSAHLKGALPTGTNESQPGG